MSRKEEILNEVNNKAAYGGFHADEFIQGAEWADEHPRKGLIDIDEACEWLKIMVPLSPEGINTFINDFRKTMEK